MTERLIAAAERTASRTEHGEVIFPQGKWEEFVALASAADALAAQPAAEPVAWADPAEPGRYLSHEERSKLQGYVGKEARAVCARFSIPLYAAQPARAGGGAQIDEATRRLLADARHRIANLSRAAVPFNDPLDGPVLRRLEAALAVAPQPAAAEPAKCKACGDTGLVRVWQKDENDRSGQSDYTAEDECPECLLSAKPLAVEQPAASTVPATEAMSDERLLHLWDTHVSDPTVDHPLTDGDKLRFARAVRACAAPAGALRKKGGA